MKSQERKDAAHLALGESVWGLGMGMVAPLTVLPLLLKALGGSPVEIGLLYSIATAGFLVTQPIGMLLWTHGGGKRGFMVAYSGGINVLAHLLIAAVIWYLGPRQEGQGWVRAIILAIYALRVFGIGVIVPLWHDWVAGLFSTASRGRAVGLQAAASAIGVSLAAVAAAKIRGGVAFPANYTVLFTLAALLFAASLGLFLAVSPGEPRTDETRPTLRELIGRFAHSLQDATFSRYLVGRVLLTLGSGVAAFAAVHFGSPEGGNVPEATVIGLGAFMMLSQALSGYWLGSIGDRAGHRLGILIGAGAQTAAIAVAWLGNGLAACTVCFVCLGLAYGAGWVSHQNMIFETCPHDNRVAHITLSNLILVPFVAAVPVATGYLVAAIGRVASFGVCLIPTVVGVFWLLLMVKEPREILLEQ